MPLEGGDQSAVDVEVCADHLGGRSLARNRKRSVIWPGWVNRPVTLSAATCYPLLAVAVGGAVAASAVGDFEIKSRSSGSRRVWADPRLRGPLPAGIVE